MISVENYSVLFSVCVFLFIFVPV